MCTFIAMALAPNGDLEKAIAAYKRFGDYIYQVPENANAIEFSDLRSAINH